MLIRVVHQNGSSFRVFVSKDHLQGVMEDYRFMGYSIQAVK
jgi:hypothetical protein